MSQKKKPKRNQRKTHRPSKDPKGFFSIETRARLKEERSKPNDNT